MSETSERFAKVAAEFTARVQAVPNGAWENQSPCEGWTARDVVRHMVDSTRHFVGRSGYQMLDGPSVEDDPLGAWENARASMQAALDDPQFATREYETRMGTATLEQTMGSIGVGDVLVHTWDLARATGQDERLDPDEVQKLFAVMRSYGPAMRQGTAFGDEIEPAPDADEQTKLLNFTGRRV